MKLKYQKKLLVFNRIPFESGTTISHTLEQDNCHLQSMSYETPLRFNTSLTEIFSESGSPRDDEKIWWNCSHADFTRAWDSLKCWLSKGVLERCFLKTGLTKSFTVCDFRNKVPMTIIFFSKCLKFDRDSWNETKKSGKIGGFKDNSICIGDDRFTQYRAAYFSLAVNVLRNTPKIQRITKGEISQIRVSQSAEKIWWKCT